MAPAGRFLLLLSLAIFAPACGEDDEPPGTDDAGVDARVPADAGAADAAADTGVPMPCPGPVGADLLRLEPLVEDLTGARSLASDGTTAVVCGQGFVRAAQLAGGVVGAPFAMDGTCAGVAVDGARAAVTTADGQIVLLSLSGVAELAESARSTGNGAVGGAAFVDDTLVVAAGAAGLLRFDVADDTLVPLTAWIAAGDARDVAAGGPGRLAVADGGLGALLLDTTSGAEIARIASPSYDQILIDPDAPGGVRDVVLPFEATTIAATDDWLLAGCGGYGTFRATRAGDTLGEAQRSPTPFGRPPGVEGVVWDVALEGDELFYADGSALVRMGLSGDAALRFIARELRPGFGTLGGSFWVSLSARSGEVLALSTSALFRVVREPAADAPSIDLGRAAVSVRGTPGGDPATVLLQVGNFGDVPLAVRIAGTEPAARFGASILGLAGQPGADPDDPLCLRVPPGPAVGALEIAFSPTDGPVPGTLVLDTNDPDQTEVVVPVTGNPTALAVGDVAPDFALPALDGSLVRLADFAGEVVLLKFFNFQ